MHRIIAGIVILSSIAWPVQARMTARVTIGVISVQAPTPSQQSMTEAGHMDIEIGSIDQDGGMFVGLTGWQATSLFYKLTQGTLYAVKHTYIEPFRPDAPRWFFEAGPAVSRQRYVVLGYRFDRTKYGAVAGLGIELTEHIMLRARYTWIQKQGVVNPSSLQIVAGWTF